MYINDNYVQIQTKEGVFSLRSEDEVGENFAWLFDIYKCLLV